MREEGGREAGGERGRKGGREGGEEGREEGEGREVESSPTYRWVSVLQSWGEEVHVELDVKLLSSDRASLHGCILEGSHYLGMGWWREKGREEE